MKENNITRYRRFFTEKWAHSNEFKDAIKLNSKNGYRDNTVNASLSFGERFSMNPEIIWKWALSHNYNLVINGYKIVKDPRKFINAILSDSDFEA